MHRKLTFKHIASIAALAFLVAGCVHAQGKAVESSGPFVVEEQQDLFSLKQFVTGGDKDILVLEILAPVPMTFRFLPEQTLVQSGKSTLHLGDDFKFLMGESKADLMVTPPLEELTVAFLQDMKSDIVRLLQDAPASLSVRMAFGAYFQNAVDDQELLELFLSSIRRPSDECGGGCTGICDHGLEKCMGVSLNCDKCKENCTKGYMDCITECAKKAGGGGIAPAPATGKCTGKPDTGTT